MIQAILFDVGGVLIHEGESRQRLETFDRLLGWKPGAMHRRLYSGPWWEAVSTGQISVDAYWAAVGRPFEALLPPDFPRFADNFYGHKFDMATVHLARRLRPYYRLGILSNATEQAAADLAGERRLRGIFDAVLISALEGVRKPDAAIFALAAQRLGLEPAACVLIDDKERNTTAAQAAGMRAIVHSNALQSAQALHAMGIKMAKLSPRGMIP